METAPLMCAGLVVFAELKRRRLERGDTIGIRGCERGGGERVHLGMRFGMRWAIMSLMLMPRFVLQEAA